MADKQSQQRFSIRTSEDFLLIDSSIPEQAPMVVQRSSRVINCATIVDEQLAAKARASTVPLMGCDAIFGFFEFLEGPYLAVVRSSRAAAEGPGLAVYRNATKFELIRLSPIANLTNYELAEEDGYLAMVESIFGTGAFYFSHDLDITHTLQRLCGEGASLPTPDRYAPCAVADIHPRLCWNWHHIQPLIADPALHGYVTPFMNGLVKALRPFSLAGRGRAAVVLLSRRATTRQGRRFLCRGVDREGYVANFVETEQIVLLHPLPSSSRTPATDGDGDGDGDGEEGGRARGGRQFGEGVFSYVQVRGSIPLLWSQYPTLRFAPPVRICHDKPATAGAFRRHMRRLAADYGGPVLAVNLVNQSGNSISSGCQRRLGEYYTYLCKALPAEEVSYHWFDFHHECRNLRWDRLSLLMDQTRPQQQSMGYFHADGSGAVLLRQRGVARVNCMDNLDRSNVVASLLARPPLLQALGVDTSTGEFALCGPFPQLEAAFKAAWADNADRLSYLYSGTDALKTDFTRTGRRTWRGGVHDAIASLTRYYLNNFTDGWNQDALLLFLGRHSVPARGSAPPCATPPKPKRKTATIHTFVHLIVCAFLCLFGALTFLFPGLALKWRAGGVAITLLSLVSAALFVVVARGGSGSRLGKLASRWASYPKFETLPMY